MKDVVLKFHPDTVATVRKLNNLNQEAVDQLVDSFQDWLKKQNHLSKKDYSREYLERSLILAKGSLEKAKSHMEKLCAMRTLLPKFFENCDARSGYEELNGAVATCLLPQLTKEHYRIYMVKILGGRLTKKLFFNALRFGVFLCEYIKAHDYCNGVVVILDYRDANIPEFMSSIDFGDMHSLISISVNGYALRIKGIHVLTSSKALKSVVDVLKKLFGAKLASRFHVHDNIETVYEYVPRTILPPELGGNERSLITLYEEFRDALSTEENIKYFKEMSQAVADDTSKVKFRMTEMDYGLMGTFRSLNVD